MVYVGIAYAIALMRISFPPIERSLPFQLASFCPTLFFNVVKTCFLDLPMNDGRPTYLVCLESCMGPRMAKISSLTAWVVLGLKNTGDLSVLIFWPEASSYFWWICFSSWHSSVFSLLKRILSSANKRWVTLGQPLQIDMPVKCWFWATSCMRAKRPLAQRRKRLGERGSPYRRIMICQTRLHLMSFVWLALIILICSLSQK